MKQTPFVNLLPVGTLSLSHSVRGGVGQDKTEQTDTTPIHKGSANLSWLHHWYFSETGRDY